MAQSRTRLGENRTFRAAVKRLVALVLVIAGCLLLTLGSALVGGGVVLQQSQRYDTLVWRAPLEWVDARALAAETVLLPLTGARAEQALDAAFDHAHLDNAFALIAYEPFLDDARRLGALLQLGARYTAAQKTRPAAQAYYLAAQFATLSPMLSDATRLDAYVQASAGLRNVGALTTARWVTDQAYRLAEYSPTLQREQRARRLEQIAGAYAMLNAPTLASQARAQAAEAALSTAIPITRTRVPFVPASDILPQDSQVEAARLQRLAAAQRLHEEVLARAPRRAHEWDADAMHALRDALLEEDRARQAYYDQPITRLSDRARLAWQREQITWLALKYRLARGAFGVSLVPEWEKERSTIAQALSAAWEAYLQLAYAQAAQLPGLERAPAQLDVLLSELFIVRWGWYVTQSEQAVIEKIDAVTQDLINAGYPALRLTAITRNNQRLLIWLPDELYGRGEQALPR